MLEQAYATFLQVKAGQDITISDKTFRVVGIVNPGIRPAKADVYMLYDDAYQVVNDYMGDLAVEDPINIILVEVSSSEVQDKAIRQIKRLWPDLVVSSYGCYKPASRAMAISRAMAAALVIVVIVSVVLLSARSQMASLVERRREIGILKAIGWNNASIVKQILTESLIQALTGACCGSLLAIGVLYLMRRGLINSINMASSIYLLPSVFLMGFVLAIVGGIVAGSIPALVAVCQWPASLLRRI
jgi:putative ABC transport system permease protein